MGLRSTIRTIPPIHSLTIKKYRGQDPGVAASMAAAPGSTTVHP